MSQRWAIRLGRRGVAGLAGLRRLPGIEVHDGDGLWLRGADPDETLWQRLLGLPEAELFAVRDDGQLIPHQRRVPTGRLPAGSWQSLSSWLAVKLEPAALAGQLPAPILWQLVRSTREQPARVLMTTMESWGEFAGQAAAVRLQGLRFAVGEERQVVIQGTPLPPLPGLRFWEAEGIAVQAGWTWTPAVEVKVLANLFAVRKDDLVLLQADGSWDHLRGEEFVAATRSAVRLSAGEGAS